MMRNEGEDLDLAYAISHLLKYEEKGMYNYEWVAWENEIGTPYIYLKSNILVQYLMEQEGLSYDEIVHDPRSPEAVYAEVLSWYEKNNRAILFP